MNTNAVIIEDLDNNYAIVLAYGKLNDFGGVEVICPSAEECRSTGSAENTMVAGFVVKDKRISDWNASISKWCSTIELAEQEYHDILEKEETSGEVEDAPAGSYENEQKAVVDMGECELAISELYHSDSFAEISVGLRHPDDKVQVLASISMDVKTRTATIHLWEDETVEAIVDMGECELAISELCHSDSFAQISVGLRHPDDEVQDLASISVDVKTRMAAIHLWEDETDDSFTSSVDIPFYEANCDEDDCEGDEDEPITDFFDDKYWFLNNAANYPIVIGGNEFRNVEAAFQSLKCLNASDRIRFCELSAREAKKLGRKIPLRTDWNDIKVFAMYDVVKEKFRRYASLQEALLATGNTQIRPQNMNHDNFWGTCQCAACADKEKKNWLGFILMKIRDELRW